MTNRVGGVFRAIVIENNDPENLLRVRVSIPSLAISNSAWVWPVVADVMSAAVPALQSPLWIAFEDGDINRPVYLGTWKTARPGGGAG